MKRGKEYFSAVAVLVGMCIGAGVLGIPYVAAQSGFFVALGYILFIGGIILLVNLYLGEISLSTKGKHQIAGYAEKYLGKKGNYAMRFATIFGIYSAIVAYLLGVGESVSFLVFGNVGYSLVFGILFGIFMSFLLWGGMNYLKRFERLGVFVILILLLSIFLIFFMKIDVQNLITFEKDNLFLPFGVVLFALMSFHAIPEIEIILDKKEKLMKRVLVSGTLVSIIFYSIFALVVVGVFGVNTPEIATLTLGTVFIFLGIFTMFTSYLALGNAMQEHMTYDNKLSKFKGWIFSAVVPILIFIVVQTSNIFSFTKVLSIGGSVSGGLTAILILLMIQKAKIKGNRKPEYKIPINWILILLLMAIFLLGIVVEVF